MNDQLTVSMIGENIGNRPFSVTEAFHPYFAVSDSLKCVVEDIDSDEYRLVDPARGRALSFSDAGGKERYVWRANPKSHLAKNVSPIGADDWRRFICVENGTLKREDAYILKPGDRHILTRVIKFVRKDR
jgi:D-hexose-6-phosphate mutarotase